MSRPAFVSRTRAALFLGSTYDLIMLETPRTRGRNSPISSFGPVRPLLNTIGPKPS
jgi:hypothetical protein